MSRQDKGGAGMILNRGPPSELETSNKISNSGGTDMYIEHPYFYEGKYYANIDGEMIEITKEVAYAMNNFYRSSKISDNPAPQKQGHSAAWPPPVNRNPMEEATTIASRSTPCRCRKSSTCRISSSLLTYFCPSQ